MIKKGKGQVRAFTLGRTLGELTLHVKVAPFPGFHEEETTVTGTPTLAIRDRSGGARGVEAPVVAQVRSVTIPARLGFERIWRDEIPVTLAKSQVAVGNALRVALERETKQARAVVSRAGTLGRVLA
ncbi:MAG: hypothetical protein IID14_07410 [Candidatus Marinimicrobia bacterium]|nr:hypothetical protein [Candidatus Neomarinimicrobiota bacterium]